MAVATAAKTTSHPRLAKSPLVLTIAQVRFPTVLRVGDPDFIAPFQEALREAYPVAVEEHEIQMMLGPQGATQMPGQKQWRLHTADGMLSLVLASTALTFESRSYIDADDFLDRFERALDALQQHIRPALCERVGLRYINEIRQPQGVSAGGWRGLIDNSFLGPIESELGKRFSVARTIQDISLTRGPNEFVSLKHGFIPTGTTIVPAVPGSAAPTIGPFYLLDLDHFVTRREVFQSKGILASLEKFHAVLYDLFRLAITPELYERLEPVNG